MKKCPVCNTQVEDQYTGLYPNTDCTWEFEFISYMTPEIKDRYEEKLKRARAAYSQIKKTQHSGVKNGAIEKKDKKKNEHIKTTFGDKNYKAELEKARKLMDNKEYAKAFDIYFRASHEICFNGDDANRLGYMYEKGLGVPQDYSKAVEWYRESTEQGDAVGQYNLGVMYQTGRGVTQDYFESIKWYQKSAEQGEDRAKSALERMKIFLNVFLN